LKVKALRVQGYSRRDHFLSQKPQTESLGAFFSTNQYARTGWTHLAPEPPGAPEPCPFETASLSFYNDFILKYNSSLNRRILTIYAVPAKLALVAHLYSVIIKSIGFIGNNYIIMRAEQEINAHKKANTW